MSLRTSGSQESHPSMGKRAGLDLEKGEWVLGYEGREHSCLQDCSTLLGGQLWGARLPWEVPYSDFALSTSWEAKGSRAPVSQASEVQSMRKATAQLGSFKILERSLKSGWRDSSDIRVSPAFPDSQSSVPITKFRWLTAP